MNEISDEHDARIDDMVLLENNITNLKTTINNFNLPTTSE